MARLSIFDGNKIIGSGVLVPTVAAIVMSYWVFRVIIWPDALIEALVVVPISFVIIWRFLRVGIWVVGNDLVIRNSFETLRAPLDQVTLRKGYVDDISEFDRFTGGQANLMRAKVGDSFADRKFLRHRLVIDGEEHEIDAFFGRTPNGQEREAAKLSEFLETESFE